MSKLFQPLLNLACDQIDNAGGVLGHSCKVVPVDDKSDPADGAIAIRQALATNKNVVAAVGLSSSTAGSELPLVVGAHIVALTASGATAYLYPQQVLGANATYAYWLLPPDAMLGYAFSFAAKNEHISKPAVIVTDTPDTASTLTGITSGLADIGIKPSIVLKLAVGQPTYGTEVQRLVASHPDGLILSITDPGTAGTFYSNLVTAMGTINIPMLSTEEPIEGDYYKAIKGDIPATTLEQHLHLVQSSGADASNPGLKPLNDAWPALNVGPLDLTALPPFYDAPILVALAIDESHSTNPSVFAPYIAKIEATESTNDGRVRVDTYAEGKKEIEQGKQIAYWGAYGPLNWTSQHVRVPDFDVYGWTLGSSGPVVTTNPVVIPGATIAAGIHLS